MGRDAAKAAKKTTNSSTGSVASTEYLPGSKNLGSKDKYLARRFRR
jgi:hypothetical protein